MTKSHRKEFGSILKDLGDWVDSPSTAAPMAFDFGLIFAIVSIILPLVVKDTALLSIIQRVIDLIKGVFSIAAPDQQALADATRAISAAGATGATP